MDIGFKTGDKVIVRGSASGVIFGTFYKNTGIAVQLLNAIQMWEWKADYGITLLDVALHGVDKSGCKFSVQGGQVTVLDACAVIAISDDAARSIIGACPKK